MSERARLLFEEIKDGQLALLDQWKADEKEEDLILDFKEAPDPKKSDDELKFWLKAMSAFANSEGGVVVWGVECKKHGPDDPDTVKELKPFNNVAGHRARLIKAEESIQPGIPAIFHETVPSNPSTPDVGFLVSYIPKFEGYPQMVVRKDSRAFYFRAGARSLPMEHYMIADRFSHRPQPKLSLTCMIERAQIEGRDERHLILRLDLSNIGRGIALMPAISVCEMEPPQNMIAGRGLFGGQGSVPTGTGAAWSTLAAPNSICIYPGTSMQAMEMHVPYQVHKDITFDYQLFCDGFSSGGTMHIPWDVVRRRAKELVATGRW